MKHINCIIGAVLIAIVITSCGGGNKKFNPTERTSSMSDDQRNAAIAKKRAEMGIDANTLLFNHGVKFSILRPNPVGEDITPEVAELIGIKLLLIASQNGISGLGTNPNFVLGTEIAQTGRAATATTPQKMTVKYTLTFKVANMINGDVYATSTQDIIGVGNSFIEANNNAVSEIKNTASMQQMLQTASERIIDYYTKNAQTIKNEIEEAAGKGEYDLAVALANSVPEDASALFEYTTKRLPELIVGMQHKHCLLYTSEMQSIMAASGDQFNPEVGAYFKMIPTDCPEYGKAEQLFTEYEKKCLERRAVLEAKAERDEDAARELKKIEMLYTHEEELAKIEESKIKAKYEADAANKRAELKAQVAIAKYTKGRGNANAMGGMGALGALLGGGGSGPTALFGSLGDCVMDITDRFTGLVDRAFKVLDVGGTVATDFLGLDDYVKKVEAKDEPDLDF